MNLDTTKAHELRMGDAIDLTVTGSDGITASAKLLSPFLIVARMSGSAASDYCNIETPFTFNVVGARVIARASATNGTFQIKNTASAVTDAIACATDTAVDVQATIDDAQYKFTKGDDDLRIYGAGSSAPSGIIVIEIEPV